eukprot:JP436305.1.p1 GENE.JP436305.1~~JP436305.1.p1  ORF type:complete len:168 (+),score=25.49 JP436305.1:1-504(+)
MGGLSRLRKFTKKFWFKAPVGLASILFGTYYLCISLSNIHVMCDRDLVTIMVACGALRLFQGFMHVIGLAVKFCCDPEDMDGENEEEEGEDQVGCIEVTGYVTLFAELILFFIVNSMYYSSHRCEEVLRALAHIYLIASDIAYFVLVASFVFFSVRSRNYSKVPSSL